MTILKRFAFISAAGILAVGPLCAAPIPELNANIDGTLDAGYGTAIAVQTTETQFGDASGGTLVTGGSGSEIDALYAGNNAGNLYLMLTGNLEGNGNTMFIFIDNTAEPGGVSGANAGFAGGDSTFNNGLWNTDGIGGMTFPNGFNCDFGFEFKYFNSDADPEAEYRVNAANFVTSTVTFDSLNQDTDGTFGTDATFTAVTSGGFTFTLDNSNVAGVVGSGTPGAANQASAEAVTTGFEIRIPFSAIPGTVGGGSTLQIFAAVNSGNADFFSNQFIPGLTVPAGNLGADPDLSTALVPATIELATVTVTAVRDFELYR
jgi:hypothetical protein